MKAFRSSLALTAAAVLVIAGCSSGGNSADLPDDSGDVKADAVSHDLATDAVGDISADAKPEVENDALDDAQSDTIDAAEIAYWPGTVDFAVTGTFYESLPEVFSRISRYVTHVKGGNPPDPSFLGASGMGNGRVFALVGYGNPTNSMHTFAGPGYEIADGFFGDYSIHLVPVGETDIPTFDDEWVTRSVTAPVILTRAGLGSLGLETVDFVPWINGEPGSDGAYLRNCAIRRIAVKNHGTAASDPVNLVVRAANTVTGPSGGVMQEARESRVLVTRFAGQGENAVLEGKRLIVSVGSLQPAAESVFVLTHCAFAAGAQSALPQVDVESLLRSTATSYQAWEDSLVDVVTPDPMVNDFIDGTKMILKLQTAETGATCPMSEYTRTWARDNMGPVLAMLALGGFADVEGYLDYVYYAILREGDLKNSYPAALEVDWNSVSEPDWSSMPPLGNGQVGKKRVAAETPSYMVMMYGLHSRFSGLTDRVVQRQGLLHRCLFAQGFGQGRMLPFTGDETYRAAMNAAFGLELEYPHEDMNWSGNSSALWLGAAREYIRFATAAGLETEAADAATLFAEVEPLTTTAFTRPDGCFAAFTVQADGTQSLPFEDASLQVTWSGWKDGDDRYAQDAFSCLYETARTVPGEICSKLDPQYGGVFRNAWKGTYTGMMPGYTLHSMTVLGHPDAQAAFNMVRSTLSTAGDVQEYMILDDHAGLTLVYDPTGVAGDYTAKYRPWEGGIVVDAVMQYLFGFEPDAFAGTIDLRPHLPNGWPTMSATGLRGGDDRFDVTVTAVPGGHDVTVKSHASKDWMLNFRWDGPESSVAVDVNSPGIENVKTGSAFGQPWVEASGVGVPAGSTVVISVR